MPTARAGRAYDAPARQHPPRATHGAILAQLLDALRQPPAAVVAHTLGLSLRTVRRYNLNGRAPLAVRLALFWLTPWGRSLIDAQATNDARLAVAYLEALKRQVAELEDAVRYLHALNTSGAANDPLSSPPTPQASPPTAPSTRNRRPRA